MSFFPPSAAGGVDLTSIAEALPSVPTLDEYKLIVKEIEGVLKSLEKQKAACTDAGQRAKLVAQEAGLLLRMAKAQQSMKDVIEQKNRFEFATPWTGGKTIMSKHVVSDTVRCLDWDDATVKAVASSIRREFPDQDSAYITNKGLIKRLKNKVPDLKAKQDAAFDRLRDSAAHIEQKYGSHSPIAHVMFLACQIRQSTDYHSVKELTDFMSDCLTYANPGADSV